MTATSEERREVAERLRGPFDVCRCEGHIYINGLFLGMQVCARNETGLRKGMRHLAELIDPTCEVSSVETYCNELGQLEGWEFHLTCGHTAEMPWNAAPAYCPECGARCLPETS